MLALMLLPVMRASAGKWDTEPVLTALYEFSEYVVEVRGCLCDSE